MTDSPNDARALPEGLPPSIVLDPYGERIDTSSVEPIGTVVLLLAGGVDREWATDAAIELSAGWARNGRRIVLADLHLEYPLLHSGLDVPNLEGMVDLFLYGASLTRIARPVRDGAFYLIPAGTYATDVGEIYRHPRWRKLVAGFRDSSAALVLFVPAAPGDLEPLARWASTAILLGPPSDPSVLDSLKKVGLDVIAVLEPPPVSGTAPPPSPPPEERILSAPLEIGIARTAPAEAAGRLEESAAMTSGSEDALDLPPPAARRRGRRNSSMLFIVLLVAVTLLVTAGYLIARLRPDLLPTGVLPRGDPPAGAAAAAAAPAAPTATRMGEVLPYSVQVRAFTSLAAASDELATEQRRAPNIPFFVSPEEIQGILYFKILAGLAPDTLAATQLRDQLVQAGAIDGADVIGTWSLLQFGPLAFDLGEYADDRAAGVRIDSLQSMQIPSYLAVVPYSDGSRRWQVYGGAYRDSLNAGRMGEMIEAAGLSPRLTSRVGAAANR
jgi:hypothetical protein